MKLREIIERTETLGKLASFRPWASFDQTTVCKSKLPLVGNRLNNIKTGHPLIKPHSTICRAGSYLKSIDSNWDNDRLYIIETANNQEEIARQVRELVEALRAYADHQNGARAREALVATGFAEAT